MSRKPFDDAFKDLAEQDPEALLQLIGALPPGATVTPLPRGVAVQALLPDQPFEINVAGARHIVYFEAQTYYAHDLPYRITDYDVRLWIKYSLPVYSYVVVYVPEGMPPNPPNALTINAGGLNLTVQYQLIGLWQISAAHALSFDRESLLPFVPLMQGGDAELRQSAAALQSVADEVRRRELALHFVLVGSLRYRKQDLLDLLGGSKMIPLELLRRSEMYQSILEEGREEGLEEGREESRRTACELMADLLRQMTRRRFPELTLGAELESIRDLKTFEQLCLDLDNFTDATAWEQHVCKVAAANSES